MNIDGIFQLCKTAGAICTDTREIISGSVFIALHGANFDGNLFALSALEKGCSYAVVDANPNELDAGGKFAGRMIKVADTLNTYKQVARLHRREFAIPVVAVTGTNGKTTTKELLAAVLGTSYKVLATQGNLNNDVGVPKTLLRLSSEDEIAVIEMGASHPGDIKTLAETAEPACGLITNIGRAHLEGFGGVEGVKATKGELYDYLAENQRFAFLNTADSMLVEMARERHLQTVGYVPGEVAECAPYLSVRLAAGTIIRTQLIGAYNLPNILAAVTVGRHFGVRENDIAAAIEAYRPQNNRSQLTITSANELIVDAYNANPSSMAAAIDNFARITSRRPKMLILGDMAELGAASGEEHEQIVNLLKTKGLSDVWLVGSEFKNVASPYRCFADVDEVKTAISREQPQGKCILIKGSHSARLFELPALL
ncbi:MAG: UDP-N-acetylmuramoyl-tripeptide--D-alanyl-D-alanine ligase [Prevotella sp.]|nr:UDP-N-acetylmuramoyl-tripeptide--D-alanyl-D-alanine ligase [Prevotella sp.]